MNNEDKRKVRIGIYIAGFAVVLFLGLKNIGAIAEGFDFIISILGTFIIAICFAFVLNLIMTFIEERIFKFFNKLENKVWMKLKRPFSLVLTLAFFFAIIIALITFILPQLIDSCIKLINNLELYIKNLEEFANGILVNFGFSADIRTTLTGLVSEFSNDILNYIGSTLPNILKTALNFTTSIFNVIMGFMLSLYILISKEDLGRRFYNFLLAFLPRRVFVKTIHVAKITNRRFTGFVAGQLIEAVILGVLNFIGMIIFKMEYALLISVILGICNVIPMFGPIIGAVPGVIIMLMIDPMKAVWFVVFVVILQQLESNLIYPRVVGDSIGLPGIFVLFAIIVGGNMFGLVGILLGVPVLAVIYTVVSEETRKRLIKKEKLQKA